MINPSDAIYLKAKDKLELCNRFKTCLDARVCPNCGEDLKFQNAFDDQTIYRCPSCGFTCRL